MRQRRRFKRACGDPRMVLLRQSCSHPCQSWSTDSGFFSIALTISGVLALLGYTYSALWGRGVLATVSWNTDVLYYALTARQIANNGIDAPSVIVSQDVATTVSGDVPGAAPPENITPLLYDVRLHITGLNALILPTSTP